MGRRKTAEEVKVELLNKGLHLLPNENYKNNKVKMNCCDNEGYYYYLSLDGINDKRTSNFDIVGKRNPHTIQNINNFIKLHGSKTKLISKEYIDNKTKMEFVCECGNHYLQDWTHMKEITKVRCNECGYKISNGLRSLDIETVSGICKEFGFKLIEGYDVKSHELYVEDIDGYKYKTSKYSIEKGAGKTYPFGKLNPFSIQNICNYIEKNEIDVELVDKTEREFGSDDKLQFYCSECGEIFESGIELTLYARNGTHKTRCDKCVRRQSNLEFSVEEYLKSLNIKYEKEKRFEDCRIKRALPFDFYLPEHNFVIEIHGSQHYYENDFFKQSLKERKEVDVFKEDYCVKNKIGYLEIPFWKITGKTNRITYKEMIDNVVR